MKKLLITDLDNTLFDWVDIWYQSFSAMLNKLTEISGISSEVLIPEIRRVHQQHGTSEYAFLLEELPSLRTKFRGKTVVEECAEAITAYRQARAAALKLYPTVLETLDTLKANGVSVFAYTESMAFYSSYRVRKLDLDGRIDVLFSPMDHDLPRGLTTEDLRKYPQ
ncbi:HAD family hydrolase, partial [Shimia sp.]|uniref:HAD family hydrolase n=1 Tax=Shimia sp. TaxID=1954381 RepID=UPI003562E836